MLSEGFVVVSQKLVCFDVLTGLCFAELVARIPTAGSVYHYCSVTFGELCGFVIGWNFILGFVGGEYFHLAVCGCHCF